jgi:hypothetical protein
MAFRDSSVVITSVRVDRLRIPLIAVTQLSAWSLSANLHHRPLDHRTPTNTRSASRKPALISLSVLINLTTLITPLMPIKLINSVILRTRLTQINSNHLLGFRGMRTWLCVDATQTVILVGVLLSEARCRCC